MADIDERVIVERLRIGGVELWGEKIDASFAKRVDHGADRRLVSAGQFDQFAEWPRPPNRLCDGCPRDKAAEHRLDDALRRLILQILEQLIGVLVERTAQSADRLVVSEPQHKWSPVGAGTSPLARAQPHAVERVLQERQLIGAASLLVEFVGASAIVPGGEACEVVEQLIDQRLVGLDAANVGGSDDRHAALLARKPRDEHHAAADRFGEAIEECAGSKIFGAHGDGYVDRELGAVCAFEQQLHQRLRFLALGIVLIAKQFLELVGEQQQVGARGQIAVAAPLDDRAWTARQETAQAVAVARRCVFLAGEQGSGQVAERIAAGTKVGDVPA